MTLAVRKKQTSRSALAHGRKWMSHTDITSFNVLEPRVVRTIREAFDDVVQEIQTRRGADVPQDTRAKLARKLVELARRGECDFQRLRSAALTALPF
jgi:hypothetical protein